MDKNFNIKDLENMLDELSKNKSNNNNRNFKLYTGTAGTEQFNIAMDDYNLEESIRLSEFNEDQKDNLRTLVKSGLREDKVLVKTILNG